jgi:hypothetical protein
VLFGSALACGSSKKHFSYTKLPGIYQLALRSIGNIAGLLAVCLTAAWAQSPLGVITAPPNNSTLTDSTVIFEWSAGTTANAYWIDIGSVAGGNNYYSSGNLGTAQTVTVNGLPIDGSTIYVTLYSQVADAWMPNAYIYTAFNAAAGAGAITAPANGSTLAGGTVTFNWTAGTNASAYWVDVGSTAGRNDYYSSGNLGDVLATTVSGLPSNGSTVYVTLYSLVDSVWIPNAYAYTAFNLAVATGVITSPTNNSTLSGSSATFNWTAGAGASAYWLDVGSTTGGHDYYSSGNLGNVCTITVNTLPTDGSMVYATLYSLVSGAWLSSTYTYTAFNSAATAAGVISAPAMGSTLTGSTVAFNWSSGTGASAYWIDVGSTPGGHDFYSSGNLGQVLTATVSGLPTDSSFVYVTLYSLIDSVWISNAYTYTSFNLVTGTGVIISPANNSILSGSSVTFNWTAGTGVSGYWLDVGSTAGGHDYSSSGNLGNVLTTAANGLPTDGSLVYATLYSLVNATWLSNGYSYTASNSSGTAGVMIMPTPGSTLTGSTVTFNWTSGTGASAYWVDVGSTAGGHDYYSSGNLGPVLTITASGLPTDGSNIYVTLYSSVSGNWLSNAYTYKAFNSFTSLAVMQTPAPASSVGGNSAMFTWTAGLNATGYWLDIGSAAAGSHDIYSSGNLGNVLSTSVYSLPADGSTIYVTLYSLISGQWWSNAYTYVSVPILTYSARTDNCVNGTQSGCISGVSTGKAGAPLLFQEGVSDPIPSGFTATTISSGSCPSGWTPSTYPAYCPAPMNSTATDPDFGSYLVMITDENTNTPASATPYKAAWNMESDGEWDAFSWDETLFLAKNNSGGETIFNVNPLAIHAQTCAIWPGCVNKTGIHSAQNGGGTSTSLAYNGSWSFSRNPSEPHVIYERANVPTQVNKLVINSSILSPGTGTLTRTVYADFQNGTGSYGGVMNTAAPGNNTTYTASWTGSFQIADDGSIAYAMTGGYDWQASWAVTVTDTFILPTVGNTGKYGFQATTGGTTGTNEPTWCQTAGCTVTDGTVIWTNIDVLAGQSPGFDVVIYRPPGTSAPGYTRINSRLGKIYRGAGNPAPAGYMTTNDQVVCTRAGTYPSSCNLPDRFTVHEAGQPLNGQYLELTPTGGGGSNAAGNWNSGTLSCQTTNGIWSGSWSSTVTYSHLNVVVYGGSFWNATTAHGNLNQPPPSSGWPTGNTYWTGTEAYCNSYYFDTTSTMVAPDTDWVHGAGHGALGYLHKYWGTFYRSMLYSLPVINGVLNPDTPMLVAALPSDDHGTYRNAGTNDLAPIFSALTDVPAWQTRYDVSNGACYDEICAFNSSGNGLTYRFGHIYNTGSSFYFQIQNNIAVISPFGDLIAFGTDMMGTRGSNATPNTACNNLRAQYQPSAKGSVTYQDYAYPVTNNNKKDIFQATGCGAGTTGATCTEGATLPNWDSACSTTCSDGGVTWTNVGANSCRGDIVILDVLSSHPAP